MPIELDRDDPVRGLISAGTVQTAEIVEEDGYQRVHFTPDGLAHFEEYLAEELDLGEKDYAPVWDAALRCENNYEGLSANDELLTLPITKRDVNYTIAYLVNRVWEKEPLVTVRPEQQQQFTLLIPGPMVQTPAGPQRISRPEVVWSEDVARNLEQLMENKLRKRIPYYEVLRDTTTQMVKGVAPAWVKMGYSQKTRTVRQPKVHPLDGGWVTVLGTEEVDVPHGESHKMQSLSTFDVMLPADAMDVQEAPWIAQRLPTDATMFRHLISTGEYEIEDPAALEAVLEALSDVSEKDRRKELGKIDHRLASRPRKMHDVWEVWLFWPIVDGEGQVSVYSLCVHFHKKAKKLLKAYLNPRADGLRPYEPFLQRKRAGRLSGGSTGEDMGPFQKVVSVAYHLQLNNAAQANLTGFFVRSGSKAWNWLAKNKVGPGAKIPVDRVDEIKNFQVGANFRSMEPEIRMAMEEASRLSVVSDTQRGDVPNRSPTGTTEAVMSAGNTQINMVLEAMRYSWSRVFGMLASQMQQYDMYGESIPYTDPKTQKLSMLALHMPVESITEQFTYLLSASSEDDSREQRLQRAMQSKKMLTDQRKELLSYMGPMFNAQSPPVVTKVMRKLVVGSEELTGEILELSDIKDRDRFVFKESELDALLEEHGQWVQQKQAEAAQEQQDQAQQGAQDEVSESINFKDLPPDGKVQMAAKVGIQLHPDVVAANDAAQRGPQRLLGGGHGSDASGAPQPGSNGGQSGPGPG